MTLIIKPAGSGNFARVSMTLSGKHAQLFSFMYGLQPGQRFDLAGITWVVCEVWP